MSPSGGPVQYDRRPQSEIETEAPSQSGHDVFTSMGAGEEAHFGRDLECEGPQIWCPPNDGLEQHLVDLELASRTRDVSNQDILYEQLAHVFAYGQGDRTLLAEWGWVVDERLSVDNDPVSGFAMMVFRVAPAVLADPLERRRVEEIHGRRIVPVVAFRGTDICVEDLLGADTDPAGIGVTQFETWRPQVEAAIGSCGRPDVTGHSLGGALAQLAAARVGGIGRIVTFQAPGISTEDAASIDADVEATHFRVEGDLVTTAGEAMASGTIVRFDLAGFDTVDAHVASPLVELAATRGTIPGVGEDIDTSAIVDVHVGTTEDTPQSTPAEGVRREFGEIVRSIPRNLLLATMCPTLAAVLVGFDLRHLAAQLILAFYDMGATIGLSSEGLAELFERVLTDAGVDHETAHPLGGTLGGLVWSLVVGLPSPSTAKAA